MKKGTIITGCLAILLVGTAAAGYIGWMSESKKVKTLQAEIEAMKKQEQRSTVLRSVSAQMEEIANEQREISDEKREEALQQTKVANEMRLRSEIERQNALEAERYALASEKKAKEASAIADSQRLVAEHQRIQAIFSKNKADTLSYIALGRSLGSVSTLLAQAGNDEYAIPLSYAAYLYTSRYKGDLYQPAVFRPLMQSSRSVTTWSEHTGAITDFAYMPGEENKLVTLSNYGEIIFCERQGDRLLTKTLLKDSQFDFRDVDISLSTGTIYAISRSGHLVYIDKDLKIAKPIELTGVLNPMHLHGIDDKNMLIVGENCLVIFDMNRNVVRATQKLPFRVTLSAKKGDQILLFDDKGMMHLMKGPNQFDSKKVPVQGKVTAYNYATNTGTEAYGMSDGTIWMVYKNGSQQKMIGHLSRVSRLYIKGTHLYSASYDGSVKVWTPHKEKQEPITLVETGNWIMSFKFDSAMNTVWLGDFKGNLTAVNLSIPQMVKAIRNRIKRNFTRDEWNSYIGVEVPYEKFVEKN